MKEIKNKPLVAYSKRGTKENTGIVIRQPSTTKTKEL
jgi:hypothetical protein